jgi:L-alanine-DL-glutamate epimerase-like enolase superfamily enzyme
MKITKVHFERYDLKLNQPYTIAYEVVEGAANFVLHLETDLGLLGFGCAAPDLPVTGETPEMVELALKNVIQPFLLGKNPFAYAKWMEELQVLLKKQTSALAMVDMALFDLMAKKAAVPLYQFLGGYRNKIETSITIDICSLEETLAQALAFVKQGFNILKVKGGLDVEIDIERMLKIKEQLPQVSLRFDGNQGYSVQESIRFFDGTKAANIEIFEQPIKVNQDKKMGEVTDSVAIPVMADESIKSLADTFRMVRNEHINMINIKLMKVGGILEAMHINSVAKANKIEVMIGCIDESALGISAGLHFALSRPNIQFADLDGHLDFKTDPFKNLFHLKEGWLIPTEKPGLGM